MVLAPLVDAHFQLGDLRAALKHARPLVERLPGVVAAHAWLAALLAATGDTREGKVVLERLYELDPSFSISGLLKALCFAEDRFADGLCDGLRALGVPE